MCGDSLHRVHHASREEPQKRVGVRENSGFFKKQKYRKESALILIPGVGSGTASDCPQAAMICLML